MYASLTHSLAQIKRAATSKRYFFIIITICLLFVHIWCAAIKALMKNIQYDHLIDINASQNTT